MKKFLSERERLWQFFPMLAMISFGDLKNTKDELGSLLTDKFTLMGTGKPKGNGYGSPL